MPRLVRDRAELMIPRDIRVLDALQVLGTGKIDYVALGSMATALTQMTVDEAEIDADVEA